MRTEYPRNTAICETDEHWAGRNLLREAFLRSSGMPREYKGEGPDDQRTIVAVVRPDRPLYWTAESPETAVRQYFAQKLAARDAGHIHAFLAANGVNVTSEQEPFEDSYFRHTPWEQKDLVRVYGTGSHCDPYASDPATIAMLPSMERVLWNLVRRPYEAPKF